jgi:acyl-CoA thioesterase FadM
MLIGGQMSMHKRFTIEEHVRWSDIDRAGIIYYGQFMRFFEIAETELFRAVGLPYAEVFDRLDIWLPRVQIHFDFRRARLREPFNIQVRFCSRRNNRGSQALSFRTKMSLSPASLHGINGLQIRLTLIPCVYLKIASA